MKIDILVCVILATFAVLPVIASGAPAIAIYTDAETYQSGDMITARLSASNDTEAMTVDVYVALFMPNGSFMLFVQGGWLTGAIVPWLADVNVPSGFNMAATPLFWLTIPSEAEGDYEFAAGLAYPGTCNFVNEISYAPFSIMGSDPLVDIKMVQVPEGSFLMGSPDNEEGREDNEGPMRTVNISAFLMSETEITEKQWEDAMGWNDCIEKRGAEYPVEGVTWFDCLSFCNKLSEASDYVKCYTLTNIFYSGNHIASADITCDFEANGYRLATEAEWEYACRAGTTTRFYGGDTESALSHMGWHGHNSGLQKQKVRLKRANGFGIYDMHGNASEWCWDWYSSDYYGLRPDLDDNPRGPAGGAYRVARGGSWDYRASYCRSAVRFDWCRPGEPCAYCGVRLVRRP
ncbi:formylglycine-generating enzyme family protein [bacterium]|nr:formylglycine-generating enzyme family protein [bacterium]